MGYSPFLLSYLWSYSQKSEGVGSNKRQQLSVYSVYTSFRRTRGREQISITDKTWTTHRTVEKYEIVYIKGNITQKFKIQLSCSMRYIERCWKKIGL